MQVKCNPDNLRRWPVPLWSNSEELEKIPFDDIYKDLRDGACNPFMKQILNEAHGVDPDGPLFGGNCAYDGKACVTNLLSCAR